MKIKTDKFNRIPVVGDLLVFNPPGSNKKGIEVGVCIGYTKAGLPKIDTGTGKEFDRLCYLDYKSQGYYSIKSEFVIVSLFNANIKKLK